MSDNIYCYPGSEVLINKLNIRDKDELFEAEKQLTFVRLQELQRNPLEGSFDFDHLKAIHRYIFQDLYDWAGQERTVEIGKDGSSEIIPFLKMHFKSANGYYFLIDNTR